MTTRFAGVATGVSRAAAAKTAMAIRMGAGETSIWMAAANPTGTTMKAVAMLLISWPSTLVITNSPASSAYGPASPTSATSASASCWAAPLLTMAVDSDIRPPTRITVVQPMPS